MLAPLVQVGMQVHAHLPATSVAQFQRAQGPGIGDPVLEGFLETKMEDGCRPILPIFAYLPRKESLGNRDQTNRKDEIVKSHLSLCLQVTLSSVTRYIIMSSFFFKNASNVLLKLHICPSTPPGDKFGETCLLHISTLQIPLSGTISILDLRQFSKLFYIL